MISICFSRNKEESMACGLRRYGVTDSGSIYLTKIAGAPIG
ncbi:MAG: hypothetical protein P8X79_07480 [Reinekea sp.]